jgi:uncharacterized protein involved in exopolysaccharide biosynthesis
MQQQRCVEEDEINLLDYWQVIRKRKRLIIGIILITVFSTAIISLFMTSIYQAKAVITPVTTKDGGGGGAAAALAQQFGGLVSLGISMPASASASEIMNLLRSNVLREKVITQNNLLPILFYKQWDEQKKDWTTRGGGSFSLNPLSWVSALTGAITPGPPSSVKKKEPGIPDTWDALRLLDGIVKINQNIKENTITISVDFHDPEMATKMVDYLLSTLTDHMSSEAKRVSMTNRKYLESQLGETSDPLIKQKIYNLIAQQIETSMMTEVKENFAFKVLDPPKMPDKKIKPKRAQMVMLAFVVALFMGIFVAFFMEYLEKVRGKEVKR